MHSAFRWGKPVSEIEDMIKDWQSGATMKDALAAVDAQNGNRALHISAQNGHMPLTKYILEQKADPSAQNFNGQTALHMSVALLIVGRCFSVVFRCSTLKFGRSHMIHDDSWCSYTFNPKHISKLDD